MGNLELEPTSYIGLYRENFTTFSAEEKIEEKK
jgi:hypothetical protein